MPIDNHRLPPLLIFALAFLIYAMSPVITPGDSRYTTHTAYSLLKHGDTNLDEFDIPADDYRIEHIDGHIYSFFPVWTAVLLVPVVAVADTVIPPLLEHFPALEHLIRTIAGSQIPLSTPIKTFELYPVIELLTSALLCAGSVVLFYLIALQRLRAGNALWVTLIFALGTSMWSTVSRALWLHSPSILMLTLTLWLLLRAQKNKYAVAFAGASIALAFMFRPTNAVALVAISTYVFFMHRRQFISYLLVAMPFAIIYVVYNLIIYKHPFATYGNVGRLYFHSQFWQAMAGNWISPARGLLVFSPALALAGIGFWRFKHEPISLLCLAIITAHWVVVSMYPQWWGGFSYGPRFFSDMMPFFGFGVVQCLRDDFIAQHALLRKFAIVATIASVIINANGALRYSGFLDWNAKPNIDQHPERLWDWSDPQFLRGV